LSRLVAGAAVIRHRLGRHVLLMSATEILTVRAILTIRSISATTVASAPAMSKSILSAVTLVVAILPGILLRLPAARDECRKTADILLSAFMTALVGRVGLLLMLLRMLRMLRPILDLLITRRKRLSIARQIRLLLRLSRSVAWLVLTHVRLIVFFVPIEGVITGLLLAAGRAALLMRLLLIVVRVLLTKLLLRRGDQAKVVLGVLIIILGGHRVARPLRVTRELDVFFRDMRSGAADFDVGTVRLVNAREGILTLAVVASPPHALLTVSHVVPVRRPFTLSRHSRRTLNSTCKSKQISLRGRTCVMSAPMIEMSCPYRVSRSNPIAAVSAAALPTSRYAHRPRFRKMMRPTGEASRPVSGDFVCRLFAAGSSSSALRRISQSRFAPEFLAMQPSRVDSVTGS
jgi:hypothetical protein